jgi:capsule polysaccharide modification protein KpsS
MRRFADDLRAAGVAVTKVNLHAGEALFFPDAVAYRGTRNEWPAFVRGLLRERSIDAVFVYGDCRPYHRMAIEVARELGVAVWVLEEGYLRPDWITLERDGVNGNSHLSRDPDFYRRMARTLPEPDAPEPVGDAFLPSALYSIANACAITWFSSGYPSYEHHRPMHALYQTRAWVTSAARKQWFGYRERHELDEIVRSFSGRYFFVPLQVHCDFQLDHSRFDDIPEFVEEVVSTFARVAREDEAIVIKHHPMDRAYREYGAYMRDLARRHGLGRRLRYVHDLHLPTLLKHARGTVTINSTVGLSSLHHGTPVKTMGYAVYDMPGLTHQGSLEDFFRDPGRVDPELYDGFRKYLIHTNQANGSYYKRLPGERTGTGVRWSMVPDETPGAEPLGARTGNAS